MTDVTKRGRLADWFRQWGRPLRNFLIHRASVPPCDVEDVSQEVFLRLLRYSQVELVEHPQAYLFKMASNVAAEWSARPRYSHPHESEWLDELIMEDLPENDADRESVKQEIVRAINALPSQQRKVLKLQFAEGLSYEEIAERVGTTPRGIKRSISRSYRKLRAQLKFDDWEAPGRREESHGSE